MSFPRYAKYEDSGIEWLGDVPTHWKVVRLGSIFREADEEGEDGLPLLSVSIHHGVSDKELDEKEMDRKVSRSEDRTKYKRVQPGDLVYNMMRAWQGGFGSVGIQGMVSPAYVVARPTARFSTEFIENLLRTPQAIEQMRRLSHGVTDFRLRLYWEEFKSIKVVLPPSTDQLAIVRFLDRETSKLDELVVEQRRLIELLKEKRQAVISHAVTKGLDPHVPMKSSGIEWLGDIPGHWDVSPIRRLINNNTTITYGIVQAGPDIEDGIPYIRTSDMAGDALPCDGYLRTTPEIDASYARSKVRPNDLVVAIRASLGKGLLVPDFLDGANLTQGTARISPGWKLLPQFLYRAFNSNYCQTNIRVVAKGTTFLEITLDALRR